MADGKIEIDIELNDSKASSQAKKTGEQLGKQIKEGVDSGLKDVKKAADNAGKEIEKPLKDAANNAKESFSSVGSSAKASFGDVGDAARGAAGDASSAFESVPADAANSFADVSSEAESGFSGVTDAAQTAADGTVDAFEGVGDSVEDEFDGMSDAAENAGDDIKGVFGTQIPASTVAAVAAITAVAAAVLEIANNSIETGKEFDAAMSQVAATMGKSVDEIKNLRDFAQEMGETTAFSASQSAEALNYMALAGYDAETSMRVLPTVLNLAAAGNMDLARASDMVTDAQSALGLSVEQAEVMVDQMATTSSKTNTSVAQLGEAFLTVGGTAKNLKGGTKELAQMLGLLADNGIKGAEGGTTLRNVILSMSAPTDKAAKAMEKLGLQVFDAQGNMREMPDIFNDLNSAMAPLTQQERTNILNDIFNKVDLKGVNALLGTSADRFDEVASAIDNAQGSAKKMADTQLDNLAGDVTLLESATEGFQIAVSDQLTPALRAMTQFATNNILPLLTDLVKNFDKIAPAVMGAAGTFAALKIVVPIFKDITKTGGVLNKTLGVSETQFKAMSTSAKLAALQTKAASVAMNALKSALPILVISAAVEVVTMLWHAFEDAKKKQEDYTKATDGLRKAAAGITGIVKDEADAFGDLSSSVSSIDLEEITQQHIDLAQSITEAAKQSNIAQASLTQYGDAIAELADKGELTGEEVARLKIAVDQVNEACGTSYEVVGGNGEAYRIMADGAEVATNKILEVIDAQKRQIRAEYELEQQKAIYAQLIQDNEAVAEQTAIVTKKQEEYNEALKVAQKTGNAEHVKTLAAELKKEKDVLEELKGELGATQSASNKFEEQQVLTQMASEKNASALVKAAEANIEFVAGVQGADVNLIKFTEALEEMGFTAQDVSDLTVEQATKMALGWAKGTDELVEATKEVGVKLPKELEKVGNNAEKATKDSGKKAGKAFHEGLSEESQRAVEAAIATVGMTIEEFDKAAEEAGIEGDEAAVAFAKSIAAGEYKSKNAGQINASAVEKGLATTNLSKKGLTAIADYYNAISSKVSETKKAAEKNAEASKEGIKKYDDQYKKWGGHIIENYAGGMNLKKTAVTGAANAIADSIKSVLGHTVPEEGVLREGGKGEVVWGEHLVENIAEGMTNRAAKTAIKSATREVAVDINETLMKQLESIDPLSQLQESLAKGSAAFSMSAMVSGASPTYTTNNQTLNFNGAVNDPDIIAREMRLQAHYGLAGAY